MHEILLHRLSAGTPIVVQTYNSIPVYIRMYVHTYVRTYVRMLGVKTGNNHVYVQYVTIRC